MEKKKERKNGKLKLRKHIRKKEAELRKRYKSHSCLRNLSVFLLSSLFFFLSFRQMKPENEPCPLGLDSIFTNENPCFSLCCLLGGFLNEKLKQGRERKETYPPKKNVRLNTEAAGTI